MSREYHHSENDVHVGVKNTAQGVMEFVFRFPKDQLGNYQFPATSKPQEWPEDSRYMFVVLKSGVAKDWFENNLHVSMPEIVSGATGAPIKQTTPPRFGAAAAKPAYAASPSFQKPSSPVIHQSVPLQYQSQTPSFMKSTYSAPPKMKIWPLEDEDKGFALYAYSEKSIAVYCTDEARFNFLVETLGAPNEWDIGLGTGRVPVFSLNRSTHPNNMKFIKLLASDEWIGQSAYSVIGVQEPPSAPAAGSIYRRTDFVQNYHQQSQEISNAKAASTASNAAVLQPAPSVGSQNQVNVPRMMTQIMQSVVTSKEVEYDPLGNYYWGPLEKVDAFLQERGIVPNKGKIIFGAIDKFVVYAN